MSHKVKIGGKIYSVTGGKTKRNGTVYAIKKGLTRAGESLREIVLEEGLYLEPVQWTERTGVSITQEATDAGLAITVSGGTSKDWGGAGYMLYKDGAPYPLPEGSVLEYSYGTDDMYASAYGKVGLYTFVDLEDPAGSKAYTDFERKCTPYTVDWWHVYVLFLAAVGEVKDDSQWAELTLTKVTVDGEKVWTK